MNRAAVADLIGLGEGFATESWARETAELGREMRAFANATDGTTMLGATDDGEVVGMAETAGSSWFGRRRLDEPGALQRRHPRAADHRRVP